MIEFTLFGVPVRVHPIHWVGLALLGGIFFVSSPSDLLPVALFMIAGFTAILAHEMGHALCGRFLGQAASSINLIFLGGYTQYYHPRFTRHGRSLSILAGPFATVLVGVLAWIVYMILYRDLHLALTFLQASVYGPHYMLDSSFWIGFTDSQLSLSFLLGCFVWIAFWWTILNMLPIMPLDGGQLMALYVKSPRTVHLVGVITACVMLVFSLLFLRSTLLTLFMIFMGIENFKGLRAAPF